MFNHSEPVGFWLIGLTVVAIFVIIALGVYIVKQKQPKDTL